MTVERTQRKCPNTGANLISFPYVNLLIYLLMYCYKYSLPPSLCSTLCWKISTADWLEVGRGRYFLFYKTNCWISQP